MMRGRLKFLVIMMLAITVTMPLVAQDAPVTATPIPGNGTVTAVAVPPAKFAMFYTSADPNNLFPSGRAISLTAHIQNPGAAQEVVYKTLLIYGFNCVIDSQAKIIKLDATGTTDVEITFPGSEHFPNGAYQLSSWLEGVNVVGVVSLTNLGIWNGPANAINDRLGISYQAPLAGERTLQDMNVFKRAGVGWLRFPMQGWLTEQGARPPQADIYDPFIREATRRNYKLLAAFVPKITVDRTVFPDQAEKEYAESLLAATARYSLQLPYWELQRIPASPVFLDEKGIGFNQLVEGNKAIRIHHKDLNVVYSFESPFKDHADELMTLKGVGDNDILGMRYNFISVPENSDLSISPANGQQNLIAGIKDKYDRNPSVWVTDYGFELKQTSRPVHQLHQAAFMSRALILDRKVGIERSFWRYDPASSLETPFLSTEGGATTMLLALRTTAEQLRGAHLERDMSSPALGIRAYLFHFDDDSHYTLVAWAEAGGTRGIQPLPAITIKSAAKNIPVFDTWGNGIELSPVDNIALLQVDEFPRFANLGKTKDIELFPSFITFENARPALSGPGANVLKVHLIHDPKIFKDKKVLDLSFQEWPGNKKVDTMKAVLIPNATEDVIRSLSFPNNPRVGQLYTLYMDVLDNSRRIGHFEIIVGYNPAATVQ